MASPIMLAGRRVGRGEDFVGEALLVRCDQVGRNYAGLRAFSFDAGGLFGNGNLRSRWLGERGFRQGSSSFDFGWPSERTNQNGPLGASQCAQADLVLLQLIDDGLLAA